MIAAHDRRFEQPALESHGAATGGGERRDCGVSLFNFWRRRAHHAVNDCDLIGMNRNSVSNYARAGEVPRHLALIAALFSEMNVQGLDFQAVVGRVDMAAYLQWLSEHRADYGSINMRP